jgi:hypothetical protein
MDDAGRMVTLHDLITRRGGEMKAARKAAEDAVAGVGSPAADDEGEAVPAMEEGEFTVGFLARLASAPDESLGEMQVEVSRALAAGVIAPGTSAELLADVSRRRKDLRKAVAA